MDKFKHSSINEDLDEKNDNEIKILRENLLSKEKTFFES
jgi:hypothetical protein